MENHRNADKTRIAALALAAFVFAAASSANAERCASFFKRICSQSAVAALRDQRCIETVAFVESRFSVARASSSAVDDRFAWTLDPYRHEVKSLVGHAVSSMSEWVGATPLADVPLGLLQTWQQFFKMQKTVRDFNDVFNGVHAATLVIERSS